MLSRWTTLCGSISFSRQVSFRLRVVWSTSGHICPPPGQFWTKLVKFGPGLAEFGRSRAKFVRNRVNFGRIRSTSGQIGPNLANFGPILAESKPMLDGSRPYLAEIRPNLVEFGPMSTDSGPAASTGRVWPICGQRLAELWPSLEDPLPNVAELGHIWVKFGRSRTTFGRYRAELGRSRLAPGRFLRSCTACVPERYLTNAGYVWGASSCGGPPDSDLGRVLPTPLIEPQ